MDLKPFIIISAISVLLIVCYREIFYPNNDFMASSIGVRLDCWHLSHFTLYAVFGYLYPGRWLTALLLGVLWELFEMSTQHIFKTKYWYGDPKDIIFNMMGYAIGEKLR